MLSGRWSSSSRRRRSWWPRWPSGAWTSRPRTPRRGAARAGGGGDAAPADAGRPFHAETAYSLEPHLGGRAPASLGDLRDRCAAVLEEQLGVGGLRDAMLSSLRFRAFADAAP